MVWLINRVAKAYTIPRGNNRRRCCCPRSWDCSVDFSGRSKRFLTLLLLLESPPRRQFEMIFLAQRSGFSVLGESESDTDADDHVAPKQVEVVLEATRGIECRWVDNDDSDGIALRIMLA